MDFFSTAWKIIESPRQAFREITLAEHKNYSLALYASFGICAVFIGFWFFKAAEVFEQLLYLIFAGIFGGMLLGVLLAPIGAGFHATFCLIAGKNASFRGSLGITAYSFVPVMISLAVVLPIELLTFGLYMFSNNPHPYAIKPVEYTVLVGADVIVGIWVLGLAILGTRVHQQIGFVRAAFIVLSTVIVLGSLLLFGGSTLMSAMAR